MPAPHASALLWMRRDLRLNDNHALFQALTQARQVYCVFVFDTAILDALENRADRRVWFIWQSLVQLHEAMTRRGSGLIVLHGRATEVIPALAAKLQVQADRKSTRLNSSHIPLSRMPSSA